MPWILAHDTIDTFAPHMLAKRATLFDGRANFHDWGEAGGTGDWGTKTLGAAGAGNPAGSSVRKR